MAKPSKQRDDGWQQALKEARRRTAAAEAERDRVAAELRLERDRLAAELHDERARSRSQLDTARAEADRLRREVIEAERAATAAEQRLSEVRLAAWRWLAVLRARPWWRRGRLPEPPPELLAERLLPSPDPARRPPDGVQ